MFTGRAWLATLFGEPKDILELREETWSAPTEGLVLVRVSAAGLSHTDTLMMRGLHPAMRRLPAVFGLEVSGEVAAVPKGSRFSVGDQVMGMTTVLAGRGGFAEYTYLREDAQLIPAQLSAEEAAGFVIAFRTAHKGLVERCALGSGEVLVVLGAAGDTGSAAIQLGKALGATVIAVASSDERASYCRALGADHVINHTTHRIDEEILALTDGHGADVVFDVVGGEAAAQAMKAVARHGRFAVMGFASGSFVALDPVDMLERNYSAVGASPFGQWTDTEEKTAFALLFGLVRQGALRVPDLRVAPFEKLPEAATRHGMGTPGKTVIRVLRS